MPHLEHQGCCSYANGLGESCIMQFACHSSYRTCLDSVCFESSKSLLFCICCACLLHLLRMSDQMHRRLVLGAVVWSCNACGCDPFGLRGHSDAVLDCLCWSAPGAFFAVVDITSYSGQQQCRFSFNLTFHWLMIIGILAGCIHTALPITHDIVSTRLPDVAQCITRWWLQKYHMWFQSAGHMTDVLKQLCYMEIFSLKCKSGCTHSWLSSNSPVSCPGLQSVPEIV